MSQRVPWAPDHTVQQSTPGLGAMNRQPRLGHQRAAKIAVRQHRPPHHRVDAVGADYEVVGLGRWPRPQAGPARRRRPARRGRQGYSSAGSPLRWRRGGCRAGRLGAGTPTARPPPRTPASSTANSSRPALFRYSRRRMGTPHPTTSSARPRAASARTAFPGRFSPMPATGGAESRSTRVHGTSAASARTMPKPAIPPPPPGADSSSTCLHGENENTANLAQVAAAPLFLSPETVGFHLGSIPSSAPAPVRRTGPPAPPTQGTKDNG